MTAINLWASDEESSALLLAIRSWFSNVTLFRTRKRVSLTLKYAAVACSAKRSQSNTSKL